MKTLLLATLLTLSSIASAVDLYTTNKIRYTELQVEKVVSGFPAPKNNNSVIKDIYKIGPIELFQGDIVTAMSETRVTNNSGVTVAFSTWMYLSTDENEPSNAVHYAPFLKFSKGLYGSNVTTSRHHDLTTKVGVIEVKEDGLYWAFVVGRAQSSGTSAVPQPKLRIDNQGHLNVVVQ